jgi:signal transduction histidine kinase/CheY-like chemotaxis protein
MNPLDDAGLPAEQRDRIAKLEEQVRRLQRTNEVLADRVERRINDEGGAFAAFQAASRLEKTVTERTAELRILNERLEHELQLRRKFEGALLRAKKEAEDATASRTRFVAAASHDLRQPLNAAVLYLESINRKTMSPADEESFRGVGLALETLDSLLSALLDISRLDSGGLLPQPVHYPLSPLFSRLSQEYGSLADAKHLELEVCTSDVVVHTDPMLLETVLRNLLSNAIKYTVSGRIALLTKQDHDALEIAVEDTGAGILPEHLDRIFDEFWRAPGAGPGEGSSMGLGLSIVKRIGHLLDSDVRVSSEPGQGSRFSLTVPLGRAERVETGPRSEAIHTAVSFNGCAVVLVDDNVPVLRSMERLLRSWDCEVTAASGFEEALTLLIDNDIAPSLLLTDYHLAEGVTGIDAIHAINEEMTGTVPAIMISSDNSLELREQLQALGIPLLTKPVDPARLRALMQHTLALAAPGV